MVRFVRPFAGKKVYSVFLSPGTTLQDAPVEAVAFCICPIRNIRHATLLSSVWSKDSQASHLRFSTKFELPFILLSDPELEVIQAYDVWKEKKMYGKVSMGVVRSTYLIDEKRHDRERSFPRSNRILMQLKSSPGWMNRIKNNI